MKEMIIMEILNTEIKGKYLLLDFEKILKSLNFPKASKEKNIPDPIKKLDHIAEEGYLISILKSAIPGIREKNRMGTHQLIFTVDFDTDLFDVFEEVEINYDVDYSPENNLDYCSYAAKCNFTGLVKYIFETMGYRAYIDFRYIKVHSPTVLIYRMTIYLDWSDNEKPFWENYDKT